MPVIWDAVSRCSVENVGNCDLRNASFALNVMLRG